MSYDVSKAPELTNPMDLGSTPSGNTCFVLAEVYESLAGVADHYQQAAAGWKEFAAFGKWLERCQVKIVSGATIFNSLW